MVVCSPRSLIIGTALCLGCSGGAPRSAPGGAEAPAAPVVTVPAAPAAGVRDAGPEALPRGAGGGAPAAVETDLASLGRGEEAGARPALAAGADFTCALSADGVVACWGSNRFGQLGDPATATGFEAARGSPRAVRGLPPIAALSAGSFHVCALTRGGSLYCWGHGGHGQLGDGEREDRATPVPVVGLGGRAVSVAAGRAHTCAARADGTVACWGGGDRGQLGGGLASSARPRTVPGLEHVVRVRAGRDHGCALTRGGGVLCWGDATEGALGDGTLDPPSGRRPAPRAVALPEGAVAIDLTLGGGSSCARLRGGAVLCWGRDDSGQLGTGRGGVPDRVEARPRAVPALEGARALALGARHACALLADASAACVGWNGRGQLGDGTDVTRPTYAAVAGLEHVVAVTAGARHSCAIVRSGGVECWGDDERAQLGPAPAQRSGARSSSPSSIPELPP